MSPSSRIEPIILGHNPFFGVDHLSQARGNEKEQRFAAVEHILEMLRFCDGLGISAMMMSTHPRAAAVCAALREEPSLARRWRIYPLVPYIHKYIRGANEKGLINLVLETLAQAPLGQRLGLVLRGGKGVMAKDLPGVLRLLIDIELLPFNGLNLGGVFLHDALTDLGLGLSLEPLLELFRDHIGAEYKVPAGLTTKNLPLLRERLEQRGWEQPLVMASFNAVGFSVNPSLERCADVIRRPGLTFVAMNTLASGRLRPEEAYRYLGQFPTIRSAVVGMSRSEHAEETVRSIRDHLPWLADREAIIGNGLR